MRHNVFTNLFLLLILLFSCPTFAGSDSHINTLLAIKICAEPKDKPQTYTYRIALPPDTFYSHYLGSDLPRWRFATGRVVTGKFHPVELVNIRIHPMQFKHKNNKQADHGRVYVSIIDVENSRTIWQGELLYSKTKSVITSVIKIDNQKYYETKLNANREENTIWIETSAR